MTRRAAAITQADVARALRAAKQEGATGVDIKPDGTIHISLTPATGDRGWADGECEPRNGLICRRNYPGDSACTRYGGKAVCIAEPIDQDREIVL